MLEFHVPTMGKFLFFGLTLLLLTSFVESYGVARVANVVRTGDIVRIGKVRIVDVEWRKKVAAEMAVADRKFKVRLLLELVMHIGARV